MKFLHVSVHTQKQDLRGKKTDYSFFYWCFKMLFQSERILALFYLYKLVSVLESRLKVFSFFSHSNKQYALVMQHLLLENLLWNTHDLLLTNKPALVNKCKPLPGLSDHDIVMTDNKISCKRHKPVKRTIYLWKNADISKMKSDTTHLSNKILEHRNDNIVNLENIWHQLKQGINYIIEKHLPQKQTSSRYTNPWANTEIKKLAIRKKKAYNKARKSNVGGTILCHVCWFYEKSEITVKFH